MNIFRNILAVIFGAIIGGIVNMTIITISGEVVSLPEGVDPEDMNSLKENIHLFQPINFLMPFLAHAIGTLIGAIITGMIAVSHKLYLSLVIGVLFLAGGIMMALGLDAPLWFDVLDIGFAYIPMAYLGYILAIKFGGRETVEKPDVLDL